MEYKKTVGIMTQYHNSDNYGGNLQAYALCKVISENFGLQAEQISYVFSRWNLLACLSSFTPKRVKEMITGPFLQKRNRKNHPEAYEEISRRTKTVLRFNQEQIPHSEKVYTKDNIQEAGNTYDIYITGSDQVWYPGSICPAYTLGFTEPGKVKFSYAASLSNSKLNKIRRDLMRSSLQDYCAISVREENTIDALKGLTDVPVQWVVDPTLLLTDKQWDSIAAARQVEDPYLFCYFLTDGTAQRKLSAEYAKRHGMRLVTIPYLTGQYRPCDDGFGDMQLCDVSPEQFISLIKYADCIFTDSFHGTVFGSIYQKNFFSFGRTGCKAMNPRLYTLTKLLHKQCRFCDSGDKINLEYIEKITAEDRTFNLQDLENMRSKSLDFLEKNLNAETEKI